MVDSESSDSSPDHSDTEEKDTDSACSSDDRRTKKTGKTKKGKKSGPKKSASKKKGKVTVGDSSQSSVDSEEEKTRKKKKKGKRSRKRVAVSDSSSEEEADVRSKAKRLKGGGDPEYAPAKLAYELDELASSVDPSSLLLDTQQVSSALFGMMGIQGKSPGDSVSCLLLGGATADPKLKKKIWEGSYVELGSLAPKSELRPRMFVDQSKDSQQLSLTPSRVRPPRDLFEWICWFSMFASLYTTKYPKAGPQMWGYLKRIMGLYRRDMSLNLWREYDEEFRRIKACCPGLPWHLLQPHILSEVQDGIAQDTGSSPQGQVKMFTQEKQEKKKPGLKLPRNGTCHSWNTSGCRSSSCKYKHVCCFCKADHKATSCTKAPNK